MDVRPLDPDDLEVAIDIRSRSFGPVGGSHQEQWFALIRRAIEDGLALGVYDGPTLVAHARINDQEQWWRGASARLAGIGGVVVAPEYRGRGVGTLLMRGVVDVASASGYPLSALYPATVPVYRALGYEFAGAQHKITIAAHALRTIGRGDVSRVRRAAGTADAPAVRAAITRHHRDARDCGPIVWALPVVESWLTDDEDYVYLADDGVLAYGWNGAGKLFVSTLLAESEQTLRAFWTIIASHSSIAKQVDAALAPHDPVRWLLRDTGLDTLGDEWWMLRIIDLPGALRGRGFPSGIELSVVVDVHSDPRGELDGPWVITVSDGTGSAARADARPTDCVRVTAGGLAALYAGTPVSTLRNTGLMTAGAPTQDAALDAAFGASAYMLDYF